MLVESRLNEDDTTEFRRIEKLAKIDQITRYTEENMPESNEIGKENPCISITVLFCLHRT